MEKIPQFTVISELEKYAIPWNKARLYTKYTRRAKHEKKRNIKTKQLQKRAFQQTSTASGYQPKQPEVDSLREFEPEESMHTPYAQNTLQTSALQGETFNPKCENT